jgi:signal transduction histidine kinase
MARESISFWNSIVTKFALFFTILLVFSILISGYLVFQKASLRIEESAREKLEHTTDLGYKAFSAVLEEVTNDISFLSDLPAMTAFIEDPTEYNRTSLARVYKSLLENKENYFQIRLIGVEDGGREIIRYDRLDDTVGETPADQLQQKGDRDYFVETVSMPEGSIYFSEINLNQEYGRISQPLIVTLRAGSPIYSSKGDVLAAVIINVDLEGFFSELRNIVAPGQKVFLVNEKGEYIFHPDKARILSSQTGNTHSFISDFDISEFGGIEKECHLNINSRLGESFIFYNRAINYFGDRYKVFLFSGISTKIVTESIREIRASSLRTLFIFCLISILFSLVFTSFLAGRINQITLAIGSSEDNEVDNDYLPIHRKDEIGLLARAFAKMRLTIKKQFEDLSLALKEEKKAKRDRDEFLQNMSHEMRTPLNAINGLVQVLKRNNPRKSQYPIIQSLERSAHNLSGLVYDVLDHQKLSEGKLRINPEPVFIDKIIKDIHASYIYAAVEKGLEFKVNIADELVGANFMTDSTRLSQVVTNLVVNAIKYTESGMVELSARLNQKEESNIEIVVADTGIGIKPENLEKINERFYREDETLVGQYGGYGLGLSIVKQLVDLFGGKLQASSKKGEGSTFTVRIPVHPTELTTKTNFGDSDVYRPEILETKKILHIEDDPSNRELVKHLLSHKQVILLQISSINE